MTCCTRHPDTETDKHCAICHEPYCHSCRSHHLSICEGCMFKILIMLFVAMIIVSYTVWFGLL